MFLPPNGVPLGGLERLHVMLRESALKDRAIVVRPHPRFRGQEEWHAHEVRWDRNAEVDTPTLLAASICSMTFGSTVSAESWAVGTPSAFFQIGWAYEELDALYRNLVDVPRIRTTGQFHDFMAAVVDGKWKGHAKSIERSLGATASGWRVLEELIMTRKGFA